MKIINEKALLDFDFTPKVSTATKTIGAYITPQGGGTTITLGTVAGGAADVEYTIACDFATATPGTVYEFEVIADSGGANPIVLLPDDRSGRPILLSVEDRGAIS